MELCGMTRLELEACPKKKLADMARRQGVTGWHSMTKDELVHVLTLAARRQARKLAAMAARARNELAGAKNGKNGHTLPHAPLQKAAARDTTAEELVESAKFNVGVPTKDLSAKVPKDLPAGYGKDRIVVMVRDPYWLHCYWALT